jgi:dienelactone hydrolase
MRLAKLLPLCLVVLLTGWTQTLKIESWPAPFQDPVKVTARFWPAPIAAGRAPAVVLQHGCGGWYGDNIDNWALWFNARGYHALAIDSFEARGHKDGICASLATGAKVGLTARTEDAYGGLAWLRARDDVDPSKVVLMGFSNGGTTALYAATVGKVPRGVPEDARFAAVIAMYPWCGVGANAGSFETNAPIQIVIGGLDDWTSPRLCDKSEENQVPGLKFEVETLPGVYHSFDMTAWRGQPVGARSYLGHRLEPNADAVVRTAEIIEAFLVGEGLLP